MIFRTLKSTESEETRIIFQYPPEKTAVDSVHFFCASYVFLLSDALASKISVTVGDRARLEPFEFLNDNLVDLYLKFMVREFEFVPPRAKGCENGNSEHEAAEALKLRSRAGSVHMFTAHFYKKLTEVDEGKAKRRKRPEAAAEAHGLVARWTKELDLFSKRRLPLMLSFPTPPPPHSKIYSDHSSHLISF